MSQPPSIELLKQARARYSQGKLAALLEVNVCTICRWETRETDPPSYLSDAIRQRILPLAESEENAADSAFTFVDLFAGIGGIRLGFEAQGGRCVFTSEWNSFARKTYLANFSQNTNHPFAGDITSIDERDILDHDVLLAGFPCQAFSIAGVSKKNALGRPHGFECTTQGPLFFDARGSSPPSGPRRFC
jgi:DNA (cytosine-5)-methyltransferase 1